MIKGTFPIERFKGIDTPFYYYDTQVLRETLDTIREELRHNPEYEVHYAIKANANPKVLRLISAAGFGADCVSGGEVRAAIEAGFPAHKVVYAGVGKSDREINLALDYNIHCFNVESEAELLIINELAEKKGKVARIALRINPNVGAHTHSNNSEPMLPAAPVTIMVLSRKSALILSMDICISGRPKRSSILISRTALRITLPSMTSSMEGWMSTLRPQSPAYLMSCSCSERASSVVAKRMASMA